MTNECNTNRNGYELCQEANRLLYEAGLDIWGKETASKSASQERFEKRMITGAFRNNSERGGRTRR